MPRKSLAAHSSSDENIGLAIAVGVVVFALLAPVAVARSAFARGFTRLPFCGICAGDSSASSASSAVKSDFPMIRVAGCDPGTSSLDILAIDENQAVAQVRIEPDELRADPTLPVQWLRENGPFDVIAGPSGYGLPLVRATRPDGAGATR